MVTVVSVLSNLVCRLAIFCVAIFLLSIRISRCFCAVSILSRANFACVKFFSATAIDKLFLCWAISKLVLIIFCLIVAASAMAAALAALNSINCAASLSLMACVASSRNAFSCCNPSAIAFCVVSACANALRCISSSSSCSLMPIFLTAETAIEAPLIAPSATAIRVNPDTTACKLPLFNPLSTMLAK